MSNHLDPDLPDRIAAAYGCLPDQGERKLLSSLDPDLAARSARAWGAPDPEGIGTARKLLSIGATSLRFAVVGDTTTDTDGAPIQRFRKDLIKVGQFKHPVEGWTLDVTADRLEIWLSAFQKMRANGVDVEITADHSDAAENIRGYMVDAFIEDDTLFGILEMRGGKGIELAEVVKNVSVELEDDFVDGRGEHYGDSIVAVAIGKKPIVQNQKPFERVAASLVA
ncbi:MAG: hypothetical protein IH889_03345 [Planctomycetes bacterium]|nr:hypothetical protein [Planctomycetota bacterium]